MISANIKMEFKSKVEKVWDVVTNNEDYQWRSDVKCLEIINDEEFIEHTESDFETHFIITKKEYCKQYEFDLQNKNMKGHWTSTFEKTPQGCVVVFTEVVEVRNMVMKLMAKPYLKKQQRKYRDDLYKKLQEETEDAN